MSSRQGSPVQALPPVRCTALLRALPVLLRVLRALNASLISSALSVSFILRAIIVRNSGKSIVPLPSASTSLIMSCAAQMGRGGGEQRVA